jgi:hypothetical protein
MREATIRKTLTFCIAVMVAAASAAAGYAARAARRCWRFTAF